MERRIWHKGVIIYYSVIHIVYGMCWIFGMHAVCFLVSILVLPGIPCDKLDDCLLG